MEVLRSNVFVRVGKKKPGENFTIIDDFNVLRETSVSPDETTKYPTTVLTLYYDEEIERKIAIATTMVIKKGIESEIKNDNMKFGLVGCLDHHIAFKTVPKKECAIYFNSLVSQEKIVALLEFLQALLKGDEIGAHYGYEPPKIFAYQLYMLPYVLGFFRADLMHYFNTNGFKLKNLKLYQGKNMDNSLDNVVGTHGNVILLTEVGSTPLTTLSVSTDRGTFPLKLELREFMATPSSNYNYKEKDSDVVTNNRLFKSVLCRFQV